MPKLSGEWLLNTKAASSKAVKGLSSYKAVLAKRNPATWARVAGEKSFRPEERAPDPSWPKDPPRNTRVYSFLGPLGSVTAPAG